MTRGAADRLQGQTSPPEGGEDYVTCSICAVAVKAKHLRHHQERRHSGGESGRAAEEHHPAPGSSRRGHAPAVEEVWMPDSGNCEELLSLATPALYTRNIFCVLGLPVRATVREVQRNQTRRKMMEKLGIDGTDASSRGYMPLPVAPDEASIRGAMEELLKPTERLLHELFWFWPTSGDPSRDEALIALQHGEVRKARDVWREMEDETEEGQIAAHNLAVLYHMWALDLEADRAVGGERARAEDPKKLWVHAHRRWRELVAAEGFWAALRQRVRDIDDVRLTTGYVRRIRSTLPLAIVLINGKLSVAAAERGDSDNAELHFALSRAAQYGEGVADEALGQAIKPTRDRLSSAIRTAKSRWQREPQNGDRYVDELVAQVEPLLGTIDLILPEGHASRESMHDLAAEAILEAEALYLSKTHDWKRGSELLGCAIRLAPSATVLSKIAEQGRINTENHELANDWCSPGYWDLPNQVIARLEAARSMMASGDLSGTISTLMELDAPTGPPPMRRALSCALSHESINIVNTTQCEQGLSTRVIDRILERLSDAGPERIAQILGNQPDPYASGNPPCLSCGWTSYTRWVHFTCKELPMFMCEACSQRHEREQAKKKKASAAKIRLGLEYICLAHEVDPLDKGVRRILATVKSLAQEVGCAVPSTWRVRRELGFPRKWRSKSAREQHPHSLASSDDVVAPIAGQAPSRIRECVALGFVGGIAYVITGVLGMHDVAGEISGDAKLVAYLVGLSVFVAVGALLGLYIRHKENGNL